MSHFVSGRASQDFDSLQTQLLRREPVLDGIASEDDDALYSDGTDEAHHAGPSDSLASRRRRPLEDLGLADDQHSQRTSRVASLYSRRNSPELPEPGPSRPRSVASNTSNDAAQDGQSEAADYFSTAKRSSAPAYRVD